MLHQRAGSTCVYEVHGSPSVHRCLDCGAVYSYEWASALVQSDTVPCCEACGGAVKPDITFFGEIPPADALNGAVEAAERADVLLILGTTLVVNPAATIPLYTLEHGGQIAIVNDGPTHLDCYAACRYDDLKAWVKENKTKLDSGNAIRGNTFSYRFTPDIGQYQVQLSSNIKEALYTPRSMPLLDNNWHDLVFDDLKEWVKKNHERLESGEELKGRMFRYRLNQKTGKYQVRLSSRVKEALYSY